MQSNYARRVSKDLQYMSSAMPLTAACQPPTVQQTVLQSSLKGCQQLTGQTSIAANLVCCTPWQPVLHSRPEGKEPGAANQAPWTLAGQARSGAAVWYGSAWCCMRSCTDLPAVQVTGMLPAQRNGAGSEGDSGMKVTERPYSPTSSSGLMCEPPMLISVVCRHMHSPTVTILFRLKQCEHAHCTT